MTMAKMMREQAVRERRARKLEKREARKRAAAMPSPDAGAVEAADAIEAPPATEVGAS